jgi:nicotinamide riboside kinase
MKKIGIMGTHGTGKTTLANNLANEYSEFSTIEMITETVRECPFPVNQGMTEQSQRWILGQQVCRETIAARLNADIIICDRTVLDPIVYAVWASAQEKIPEKRRDWCAWLSVAVPFMLRWMRSYDELYWLRPDGGGLPVDDGFRDIDPVFRRSIDRCFKVMVRAHGIQYISTC